jgi:RNA polymerase sigma-70 factor, ECF subfamily
MHSSATGKHRQDAREEDSRSSVLGRAEFESLYRQWRPALWCIAAGVLGDRTSAEDVVQDAALIAFTRRDQFTAGTNFLAWTGRIVRNVALNSRRRKKEACLPMIDAAHLTAARRNGSRHTTDRSPLTSRGELKPEQEEFDDRVLAALMQLSPDARACLLLRTVLEMTYAEIAAALDIPEGTAMSHVHRSRKHLRTIAMDDANSENRNRHNDHSHPRSTLDQ